MQFCLSLCNVHCSVPQEIICPEVHSIGVNYGCGGPYGLDLVVWFISCHRQSTLISSPFSCGALQKSTMWSRPLAAHLDAGGTFRRYVLMHLQPDKIFVESSNIQVSLCRHWLEHTTWQLEDHRLYRSYHCHVV